MNRLKSIIFSTLIASISILSSCDSDFLEKYPLDRVSDLDYFKTAKDLETYMNQFYCRQSFPLYWWTIGGTGLSSPPFYMTTNSSEGDGYDFNSDLMITGEAIHTRLNGATSINSGPWDFRMIRHINYFFDNYERCVATTATDIASFNQSVGEAHFFRALYYYRLLKAFGDVPWYSTTLGTSSEELYASRDPRHVVADNILADLDEAIRLLQDAKTNGNNRINKWVALLLQSRIALFEGTWQKYHAGTPFAAAAGSNYQKYLSKAVEAAEAVMNSGVYSIYSTGKPNEDYYDLFSTLRTYAGNSEVLYWTQFDGSVGFDNIKNFQLYEPRTRGITKSLADAYLCTDGKPISISDRFVSHNTLAEEVTDRDPRFFQTIFTPDAPWSIAQSTVILWEEAYGKVNDPNASNFMCPTGYQIRKGYDARAEYRGSQSDNAPQIQFRYAEVLLNYAEAKAELGSLNQDDIDKSIKLLRDRVDMPNLILTSIAGYNPDIWDFPELSPAINEIRRERLVELALEGLRFHDILRWAAAGKLIVGKRPVGAIGAQFYPDTYPMDAGGFYDPWKANLPNGYGFVQGRDYLMPVPPTERLLYRERGYEPLTQNPGWPTE